MKSKIKQGVSVLLGVWLAFGLVLTSSVEAAQSRVAPRGTILKIVLTESLSSKDTKEGERFEATVAEDVRVHGRVVIPAGAEINGTVTDVERAKRLAGLRGRARLVLRFDDVETVAGRRPLSATVVSVHDPVPGVLDDDADADISNEGEIEAESDLGGIITRGAIGVAAGALLGALFGNVSRGVLLGSIGGAIAILAPRGEEVELKEGTGLQIRLDRDLNIPTT